MKIYVVKSFGQLMAKRDRLRERYTDSELELAIKYNPLINKFRKRSRNFGQLFLYSIVLIIIAFLLLYKKLTEVTSIVILSVAGLLAIVMFILMLVFRYKKEVFTNEFNEASKSNQELKKEILEYNHKLAKMTIVSISYSENYRELNSITNKDEFKSRFRELFYLYHNAINDTFSNNATVEDFINYYYQWKNDVL